jgi:hypothetical protein
MQELLIGLIVYTAPPEAKCCQRDADFDRARESRFGLYFRGIPFHFFSISRIHLISKATPDRSAIQAPRIGYLYTPETRRLHPKWTSKSGGKTARTRVANPSRLAASFDNRSIQACRPSRPQSTWLLQRHPRRMVDMGASLARRRLQLRLEDHIRCRYVILPPTEPPNLSCRSAASLTI